MEIFKKVKNKEFLAIIIVIAFGLLAARPLLSPGYFNMHDDLQMMRQLEMEKCFKDFQIPCRWVPDMGYGFGFPLFNYYPPLPYLIGQVIRVFGFSFVDTAKYLFSLSLLFSGLTMYLFARQFWGKWGGLLSSIFYIWAPYHALDIYVRGAMNEAWALVWFPLILWSSYKLIKEAQFRFIVTLALSWAALLLSHNLMVLIFVPPFISWVLLWILRERSWFTLPQIATSGIWSLGLAAFFTLPVIFESKFVQVETLVVGYYEYVAHFADLNQLLVSRFWGYGASVWGPVDYMAFQVGHLHWILSFVALGIVIGWALRQKEKLFKSESVLVVLFFFAAGWFAIFMAHSRSTPVWEAIGPLKFIQFPWRFVTLATLSFSIVAGGILASFARKKEKLSLVLFLVLAIGVVVVNKDYFKPEWTGPLTDEDKFAGPAWELQQNAGIFDYLPKTARTAPKDPRKVLGEVLYGKGEVLDGKQTTNRASLKVRIDSEEATVRINILQFPGWKVYFDGKETETFVGEDDWGRMNIQVSKGDHEILAKFVNTPVRTVGNLISLFSWLALFSVPLWRRK